MKKVLMMTLAMLMVCSSIALADHIGVYEDTGGTSCVKLTFAPFPTPNNMYIVHKFNPGSTASQFKSTTSGFSAGPDDAVPVDRHVERRPVAGIRRLRRG
jgi:hypothetical protein